MLDGTDDDLLTAAQLRHERDLLAKALGDLLVASGMTNVAMTGPELLVGAEGLTEAFHLVTLPLDEEQRTHRYPLEIMTIGMIGEHFQCFAYIGEDELGSGEVGLKQGFVPAGLIPLVSVKGERLQRPDIVDQLQAQVDKFGKPIKLVRMIAVETVRTIEPEPTDA